MERAQEAILTLLQKYLPYALEARTGETQSGEFPRVAAEYPHVDLPLPNRYELAYDDKHTLFGTGDFPVVVILPGSTTIDVKLTTGYLMDMSHNIAIVVLLKHGDPSILQRQRSRYAEAIVEVLLTHQQDPVIGRERISYDEWEIRYDKVLWREDERSFLGSVFVQVRCRERERYSAVG